MAKSTDKKKKVVELKSKSKTSNSKVKETKSEAKPKIAVKTKSSFLGFTSAILVFLRSGVGAFGAGFALGLATQPSRIKKPKQ